MSAKVVKIRCANGDVWAIKPGEKLTMGRTSANDMRVVDKKYNSISRNHAVITWDPADEGPVVTDLGSSNGTLVNGVWIKEPVLLKSGDALTLGKTDAMRIQSGTVIQKHATGGIRFLSTGEVKIRSVAIDHDTREDETLETERWGLPEDDGDEALATHVSGRDSIIDALSVLGRDRETGIVTLGKPKDGHTVRLLRGRIVAVTLRDLIGNDALDGLLKLEGKRAFRFAPQATVARGGLSLIPDDLRDY